MIANILVSRKIANGQTIHIKAFRTDETLIGVNYNVNQNKHGYFVNGKAVKPSYNNNKYFNDFAALITMACDIVKDSK